MSRVTNVILHHSTLEPEEYEDGPVVPVVTLNRALAAEDYKTAFERVDQHAGGYKVFETCIYLAAFNHAATYELLRLIRAQAWSHPDWVQVFVMEEDDDGFTVHSAGKEIVT